MPGYAGLDLAWGERGRTGVAVLDSSGALVRSASVRTDDEIAAVLGAQASVPGLVVAVDAPLIVPNETGMRPCEREVTRLFGRFHAGAYPANRSRPAFRPQPRGARLADRFGWDIRPAAPAGRSVAIEVYPHPAMVALFGLERVLPYKARRGRTVASRRTALDAVLDGLEATCGARMGLDDHPRWAHLRTSVVTAERPIDLSRVEDEIDAILCAHLAWMWVNERGRLVVIGTADEGFIVTPPPPARH